MRRKPDLTYAEDIDEYIDAWNKILEPFECMGFRVISYDPGVVLTDVEHADYPSFQLPMYAVEKILSRLDDNRKHDYTRTNIRKD